MPVPVINSSRDVFIYDYIQRHLFDHPKYADPKRLNKFEFQVYSQNGEDGIIEEIFNRIGVTNTFFVEFGVENGLECNTAYLLLKEWSGLWMDGNAADVERARLTFQPAVSKGKLTIANEFINAENIEALFEKYQVPKELDFLSIDIDRNDWHVWKAITHYRPRVVSIEYNASIPPSLPWVIKYQADAVWDGTNMFGAGLKSMEILGNQKGYKLVGCNFSGVNAFFVREDLVGDDVFLAPFTSEVHFEPPKYFLHHHSGHRSGFQESFLLR